MESSSLNSDLLGLSSLESNEVLSSQAAGQETKLDTLEGNLSGLGVLACRLSKKLETTYNQQQSRPGLSRREQLRLRRYPC